MGGPFSTLGRLRRALVALPGLARDPRRTSVTAPGGPRNRPERPNVAFFVDFWSIWELFFEVFRGFASRAGRFAPRGADIEFAWVFTIRNKGRASRQGCTLERKDDKKASKMTAQTTLSEKSGFFTLKLIVFSPPRRPKDAQNPSEDFQGPPFSIPGPPFQNLTLFFRLFWDLPEAPGIFWGAPGAPKRKKNKRKNVMI